MPGERKSRSREMVSVPADGEFRFFNRHANGSLSVGVKNVERMHKVVGPGANLFPCAYAKVGARVERTHIVQELRTTGIELCKADIIQHSILIEIDLLPKAENGD